MIYQEQYEELIHAGKQIVTHRQLLAKERIETLLLDTVDVDVENGPLLAHLVSESLLKRIDRKLVESKNIYVQQFDIPQTELFYSMAEAVPFVYMGHSLANQCIARAIDGAESATIIDIGVGRGQQMKRLVELICEGRTSLKRLDIVGLDPVEQNLEDSGQVFEDLKESACIDIGFHPFLKLFEALDKRDYDRVRGLGNDALAINSAFSLHHTSHPLNDGNFRLELLRRLADLEPSVVTLVEPNSNHDSEYLPKRIKNAWLHFGTAFALIDESDIEESHKFLIKEKFFGREVRDIFGVSDVFRCERHELYADWLVKLHRAGFVPYEPEGLLADLPDYCQYDIADGVVRMDYADTTIVAVLSFTLDKSKN